MPVCIRKRKCAADYHSYLPVCFTLTECSGPLGMEGGIISNQQITASSTHRALFGLQKWYPYFARLNKKGLVNAWTAAENDRWPWIQVTDGGAMRENKKAGIQHKKIENV